MEDEDEVRVMVPNLATPMQAFSIIFIYFNSSFRCLLVRVSGNMKKRGHAVAGISFSFRCLSVERNSYGDMAGWVAGCLSQPVLYQND